MILDTFTSNRRRMGRHLPEEMRSDVVRPEVFEPGTRTCVDVVPGLDASLGGIASSTPELVGAVASGGRYRAHVLSFCRPDEIAVVPGAEVERICARRFWKVPAVVRTAIASADVVHIHGIWTAHCVCAAHFARSGRKPYVISAHGMLESWALARKRWKKALYAALVERQTLRDAACVRALTLSEMDDYRSFGLRNPVAVIPNGVAVPVGPDAEPVLKKFPAVRGRQIVLFLGRVHPKKGISMLVRGWSRIARKFPDAHLLLAGPGEEEAVRDLEVVLRASRLSDTVTLAGMLSGGDKWSALAAAHVFVLPSYSEGFSVATLEAMACGRPVIITDACKFPEVARYECGWTIRPEQSELETALSEALAASSEALARMGENGRALVSSRYTWQRIGRDMCDVYDWIQGGPRPACVLM